MNITKKMLWMGALVLAVILLVYLSTEYFENPAAYMQIPPVDPKQIEAVKEGIKDLIKNRPDVVAAVQQIMTDPSIRPTVQKLFNPAPASEKVHTMYAIPVQDSCDWDDSCY